MHTLPREVGNVVTTLCADVDTPRSLAVSLLLRSGEYSQLLDLSVDPLNYTDADRLACDLAVTELLRKCEGILADTSHLEKAALDTFYQCERDCARTNAYLSRFINAGPFDLADELTHQLILRARKAIGKILGPLPDDLTVFFGKGATFDDRGRLTTIPDKMTSCPTMTGEASCLLPFWEQTAWARALRSNPSGRSPRVVRGNRFTTVPKDSKKRRGIAVEPSINVGFQLCVGRLMKRRLFRAGLDLYNGQDVHRQVARDSSVSGKFATIDLSNASDTVAYNLVKALIPENWFTLLDALRSPMTRVGTSWVHLSKFSSMGNGFTFELETLIFLGLILGLDETLIPGVDVLVYGDDIIVPSELAPLVVKTLRHFGFTPNPRKTFLSGRFRESCGGDFFDGVPVRAHYLKELPNEPFQWIALANGIRRTATQATERGHIDPRFKRAWFRCLDILPNDIRRLRGPERLGDLVIHDNQELWSVKVARSIRYVRCWAPVTGSIPWHHWMPNVQLASVLYGVPSSGVIPRDHVAGYRKKWVACS